MARHKRYQGGAIRPEGEGGGHRAIDSLADKPPVIDFPTGPTGKIVVPNVWIEAGKQVCFVCGGSNQIENGWEPPEATEEATLHLNSYQTAILGTIQEAIARMTGKEEFRESKLKTIAELMRMFLFIDPVMTSDILQLDRPGRIARGAIKTAGQFTSMPYITVIDTPDVTINSDGDSVESPEAEAETVEDGEGEIYEDGGNRESIYDEG